MATEGATISKEATEGEISMKPKVVANWSKNVEGLVNETDAHMCGGFYK